MPSSATTSLRLEKMAAGENVNAWGDPKLNAVITRIEEAIAGLVTIALTADATLTSTNYVEDQARYAMLKFTGTGPYTVTVPSVTKSYKVWNAMSAAVTITTGSGTTVVIAASDIVSVFCDGTNVKADGYGGVSLKDYIDSVVVGGGASLPSLVSNSGKWLTNNGAIAQWAYPTVAAISDYASDQANKQSKATGLAVAFALVL